MRGGRAPRLPQPGGRPLPGDSGDTHLELVLVGGRLPCASCARWAQALFQVVHGDELAGCAGQGSALEYRGSLPTPRLVPSRGHAGQQCPGGPSGSCSPSRCPRRGCEASGPGPQWPQARTCLLDGDGEAVVVGAALGLHRHVAGRVTCRTGARQVRGRGGHTPPGTQRWPRAAGAPGSTGAGSRDTAGVAGATTSPQRACSAGALRGGSPRAWGRDTSWSHESLWNTRMNAWPRVSNEVAAEPGLGLGPRSRVIWPSPGKGPLPSPYGHALVTKDGATNIERKLRF